MFELLDKELVPYTSCLPLSMDILFEAEDVFLGIASVDFKPFWDLHEQGLFNQSLRIH